MIAPANDPALLQNQNQVRMAEATHPLGHNHLGHARHLPAQGLAQGGVGPVIQGAGGVIQHQNLRPSRQSPAMASRCFWPPDRLLPRDRHRMAHPFLEDVIRLGRPGGPVQLLLRQLPVEPNVPRQIPLHNKLILKHHAKLGSQLL